MIRSIIVVALRMTSVILLLLPWDWALAGGGYLGRAAFRYLKRERDKAERNFTLAFHDEFTALQKREILSKSFENLGKSLVEVLKFSQIHSGNIDRFVTLEGEENLKRAFSRKKGIVFVTAHFGNWELMGITLAIKGYPTQVIAAPLYDARLDRMMSRYRLLHGVQTITRGGERGPRRILSALKNNQILGLLIDQDIDAEGVFVEFFNRKAFTPSGAASLALKSGAAVILGFINRDEDNRHKVVLEGPLELVRSTDLKQDIYDNTALFTKAIEEKIRKHPDQWVWMHNRWQTSDPGSLHESS
ncbi:MAG: lysophospholipid acyltransferase family protein [Nitrospirae bacterium]|nr:lysophospholipid acyltransferase family protein [Nitrospirota bacterium]